MKSKLKIDEYKMISSSELISWMNDYLNINEYSDYCPNGLQFEGKSAVKKIILGVTASLELIEKAVKANADMILVHHGMIWKGDSGVISGTYKKKIQLLTDHNINLVAYHLPLDGHIEVGNGKALADKLGISNTKEYCHSNGGFIGVSGDLTISKSQFIKNVNELNKHAHVFDYSKKINKVAIVTGGAPNEFRSAVAEGFDCFITGEVSEWVFHMAKEEEKTFIGAGHHITEMFGVQYLGKKITETFNIEAQFIDIPNPV